MKREKFLEKGKNNNVLGKKKAEKQPDGQVLMHKTDSMLVNYIRSMEDFDSRSCWFKNMVTLEEAFSTGHRIIEHLIQAGLQHSQG